MEIVYGLLLYLTLLPKLTVNTQATTPLTHQNLTSFGENETESIYDFWKKQDKSFKLGKQKDVVLLLGNSGSGKSTTALFITGANLTAVETFEGSDEFYISDEGNKIGSETVKSHTLIPEFMIEPKIGTAYYDCPGFLDTRSLKHDITIAYFFNKLMSYADSFKLVFVVSHSSVKRGENRYDFPILVKNAVKLIKDIEEYSDGIALVVTKVEASANDTVVIKRIANFLEEVRRSLIADGGKPDQSQEMRKLNSESIKFVATLLKKRNDSFERIGIFRRAEEAGLLENIPTLQSEKNHLKTIINQNIKYVRKESNDFGFVISPESKNHIVELIDEIIKTASVADVSNICKEIDDFFLEMEKQNTNIDELYEKTKLGYQMLSEIRDEEPILFLKQILNVTYRLQIGVSIEIVEPIVKHIEYVDFLTNVINQTLTNPLQLVNTLSNITRNLENGQNWYRFLINLRSELSKNHFQSNTVKNIAKDFVRRSTIGEKEQKMVGDTELKRLLDHAQSNIYSDVEAMQINSHQMKALKNVLTEYSSDSTDITCTSDKMKMTVKMTVKGRVIKMSDVVKDDCYSNAKYIEIFALNSLIVDENINKSKKQTQILIIAPTWDVSGYRTINSDGEHGKSHPKAVAKNGSRDEWLRGGGSHGKPGLPGGTGGSFLALGDQFINGQYLTIQMNGGDAGPAQHGGNGTLPIDGKDPPIPEKCWADDKTFWDDAGYRYYREPCLFRKVMGNLPDDCFVVHGIYGTKAGDGGHGGKQGYAGNAGKIQIIELERASQFVTYTIKGNVGAIGKGGKGGGRGAKIGKTYHVEFSKVVSHFIGAGSWCSVFIRKNIDYGPTPIGSNGIDGFNGDGISNPKPPLDFYQLSFTLNKYKSYVMENLAGSTRETELRNFMNKVTNNEKVKLQYDPLGLVNELQTIEKQYFLLRNKISFTPFLESLLDRIAEFAKTNSKMSKEHKKVLTYLYTATLSKIYGIKNKVNKNTVFDLDKFLEVIEGNIDELHESVVENNVNIIRNEYKSSMDEKIRLANAFIETQIIPEIDHIFRQIDDKIMSLINESLQKQNETANAIKEQKKRRRELQDKLRLRQVLGPIKIIASVATFFCPVGAAVGAAIGGGTMLTEALALDELSGKGVDRISALVSSEFKASISRMNEVLKQRPELIKQKIYDLDKYLKENFEDVGVSNVGVSDAEIRAIKDKIKKFKEDIHHLKAGGDVPEPLMTRFNKVERELKELSTEAKDKLEKRKSELSEKERDTKNKIEQQLRMVTFVQAVVNVADVSVQFYNQIRNDEAKLKIVGDAVGRFENDLNTLKIHEEKMYNIMIPQIRQIENTVDDVSKSLEGNSHVELDVKKWNIRSILSEVRLIFNQMARDFAVQDALNLSIEKLDEGMATLIDVYDRIDSYSDSAKLAAYIADIGSRKSTEIDIHNVELSDAVTSLQKIIRSNLVLEEYEMAMHAFKQHYFPLAQFFIDKFKLPDNLQMNDTTTLIQKSVDQITDLKKQIKTSESLFNEYDEWIYSEVHFDGEIGSMPPFYIWENHAIKNEMKKLLQDQEIILQADVVNGVNQNAIKFNDIGIRMKLANSTLQNQLDAALRNFTVNMTMVGNNYYRCDNRYYSVSLDRNLVIDLAFEKIADGTPKTRNDIYNKINKNDPFLSPYAMWIIKLSGDFHKLNKFIDENINLELVGRGQYLKHGTFAYEICNDRLDKYYNLERTVSNVDNVLFYKNSYTQT